MSKEKKELAVVGVQNLLKVCKVFGGLPQLIQLASRKRWLDLIASAKDEFELLMTTDFMALKAEWQDLDAVEVVELKKAVKEAFDLEDDAVESAIENVLDGLHQVVMGVLAIKEGVESAKKAIEEAKKPVEVKEEE